MIALSTVCLVACSDDAQNPATQDRLWGINYIGDVRIEWSGGERAGLPEAINPNARAIINERLGFQATHIVMSFSDADACRFRDEFIGENGEQLPGPDGDRLFPAGVAASNECTRATRARNFTRGQVVRLAQQTLAAEPRCEWVGFFDWYDRTMRSGGYSFDNYSVLFVPARCDDINGA